MEETATNLMEVCKCVRTLMPPEGVKDLRGWLASGLTKEQLLAKVEGAEHSALPEDMLVSDFPYEIAEQFIKDVHTVDGVVTLRGGGKEHYMFDGSCYTEVTTTQVTNTLWKYLNRKRYQKQRKDGTLAIERYRSTVRSNNDILSAAKGWTGVPGNSPTWLQNVEDRPALSNLMAFTNGLFDVAHYEDTGKIKMYPPDPRLFITNIFPYALDMNARSETWEYVTGSTFGDDPDKVQLIHEWSGLICVYDMSLEKFVIFLGETRSGKGLILTAMQGLLGEGRWGATNFNSLGSDHGLTNLMGKLAAFMGDAKEPAEIHENMALERLLAIVGRDNVLINPKYKAEITWLMNCRFTIACNHLPRLRNSARAVESRAVILDFANSFWGREDTTLKDRIMKDASEGKLMPYALRGLRDLRANNNIFTLPKSSTMRLAEFSRVTSPTMAFVQECCKIERGNGSCTITAPELFEAWQIWCKKNNHRPVSSSSFGRNLHSAVPFLRNQNVTRTIQGHTYKLYEGICLQDWVGQDYIV